MTVLAVPAALAVITLTLGQCGAAPTDIKPKLRVSTMRISSSAFQEGERIPRQYTGDGQDVSPPLTWTGLPEQCKGLALICDDPDAPVGTWVHWVAYDLPVPSEGLKEAVPKEPELPDGSKQGVNSWRKTGYGGPAPPPGKAHRYFFKLYALDAPLGLKPGATKEQLIAAMKDHLLAEAQLLGTYSR